MRFPSLKKHSATLSCIIFLWVVTLSGIVFSNIPANIPEPPNSVKAPVVTPDEKEVQEQYKFDGAWLGASEYDPSEIGPNNFQVCQNMRYGAKHPEGVSGSTKINTTALTTYDDIKTGIQLQSDYSTESYVIVNAENSSGTGRIYYNTTSIPNQGDFEATQLHTDTSGDGLPRFASLPRNHIAYSNGEESYIWGGKKSDIAGLYLCDDSALANPRDYYEAAKNTLTTTGNTFTVAAASTDVFVVQSTRPLQGVWFEISVANATASTLSGDVWTTTGWQALTSVTDDTDTGPALAQDGEYQFSATSPTPSKMHLENTFLYAYRFTLDAGSATISNVSVNAPFQEVTDIWDGVPRQPWYAGINFSGTKEDFTPHVIESSTLDIPIGMLLDGLTSSDEIYLIFKDRMAGIRFTMLANLVNRAASVATVKYFNGSGFTTVSNQVDGTLDSGSAKSFNKSGLISWTPPAYGSEFPYTIGEVTGYAYQITLSGTLTGTHGDATDSVVADVITGVPAPLEVGPFIFHSQFKGRHLGCGYKVGKEGNRVYFTAPFAPDVWNGDNSSDGGAFAKDFGNDEDLTAGMAIYNQQGSQLREVWVGFTNSHTYQLMGDTPEDFQVFTVSENVGCPAPYTLAKAEIGFTVAEGVKRNIIMWLDSSGPYRYDGATIEAIPGIEKYFDPNEVLYVGADLSDAYAWFDQTYREYNLILPGNIWVVYDLEKQKWFQKSTGSAYSPQCGWPVVDANGAKYIYAGFEHGHVMRLEYGNTWDGTGITQELITGDFWPSENIWHQTLVRRIKLVAKAIPEDHDVEIIYLRDTSSDEGSSYIWTDTTDYTWTDTTDYAWESPQLSDMALDTTGPERIVRDTINQNLTQWAGAFGFRVTTSDTGKGFQPIGWGIEYRIVRDDH